MSPTFTRLLAEVKVLSLDVFDTALGRRCGLPEDVFSIMEEELKAAFGSAFEGFSAKRRDIDSQARRRAWDQRQEEEVTLEDIYTLLLEAFPSWEIDVPTLSNWEMAIERRMLYPLDAAKDMIAEAREAGKKVIFVSDMYLPQEFCEACLRENGFTDFDTLYLSSTIGVLKHSGKLFRHVIESLEVSPEEILHVGDNANSDGEQAKQMGLRSFIIPKAIDCIDYFPKNPWAPLIQSAKRSTPESIFLGLSSRGCLREASREDPFWYRIGYQVGGPLLYGYVQYIINNVRGRNIDKIYFLSRDGFILKKVYEILSSQFEDCPEADYLYASRRALNFASITELDEKTENWLAEGIHLTVGDFLKRVHMDPEALVNEIRECGFCGPEHLVVEGADYQNLRALYHRILPQILAAAEEERTTYLSYLRDKGVFSARPFVLVDVGWMTSIQQSFHKLIHAENPEVSIEGYYLGTYPEAIHRAGDKSKHVHYLMSYGAPQNAYATIRHSVCLLEFFFSAPERTFLRMTGDESTGFSPELAPMHENEEDLGSLAEIHSGILEFVEEMTRAIPAPGLPVSPDVVLTLLHRILANPTHDEAVQLGELRYADGYGSFFHHARMARPSGLSELGLSKKKWKREFKDCHWPKGYYTRLNSLERFIFHRLYPSARFSKRIG